MEVKFNMSTQMSTVKHDHIKLTKYVFCYCSASSSLGTCNKTYTQLLYIRNRICNITSSHVLSLPYPLSKNVWACLESRHKKTFVFSHSKGQKSWLEIDGFSPQDAAYIKMMVVTDLLSQMEEISSLWQSFCF